MNEAIKLAIEKGGYQQSSIKGEKIHKIIVDNYYGYILGFLAKRKGWINCIKVKLKDSELIFPTAEVLLDSKFWKSLGKALDWKEDKDCDNIQHINLEVYCDDCQYGDDWVSYAREYFEIKMTNGNEKEFWSDLLNP